MSDLERCYAAAMRILRYRFNSSAELGKKLKAKGFDADLIDEVLVRLRDEKWLDDERYAAAYVRTRQLKRVGPRRIARELSAAGVDNDTAKQALRANTDEDREHADLMALCRKRHELMVRRKGAEYAASFEGRNKLAGYLLKQGYDGALVREAIQEVTKPS